MMRTLITFSLLSIYIFAWIKKKRKERKIFSLQNQIWTSSKFSKQNFPFSSSPHQPMHSQCPPKQHPLGMTKNRMNHVAAVAHRQIYNRHLLININRWLGLRRKPNNKRTQSLKLYREHPVHWHRLICHRGLCFIWFNWFVSYIQRNV